MSKTSSDDDALDKIRNRKNTALRKEEGTADKLAALEGIKDRQTYFVDLGHQAYIKMIGWYERTSEAEVVNRALAYYREHHPFEGEIPPQDLDKLLAPLQEKARRRGK